MFSFTIPKAASLRDVLVTALVALDLSGCSRPPVLPYDIAGIEAGDPCSTTAFSARCLTTPSITLPYDLGVVQFEPVPLPRAGPARGPMRIVVSLRQQRLFAYRDDVLALTSPVSTGKPGHATPVGTFHVSQKQVFHRSNRYSNAPMPYMQRLTASGIALHAGHLPGYPASHGCIRLPLAAAKRIYRMTSLGTPVVVTRKAVAGSARKHGQAAG